MGIFEDIGSGVGGVVGGTANGIAKGLPGAIQGGISGGATGQVIGTGVGAGIGAVGGLGVGDVVTIPSGAAAGATIGRGVGSAVGAGLGAVPGIKQGFGEGYGPGAAVGGGYGAGLDKSWLGQKLNNMVKGHKEADKKDASADSKKACDTCKKFKTADEAGKAAAEEANKKSIKENLEYGGLVYKNPDGTYGYTEPKQGTADGFDPSSVSAPQGTDVIGDYHTHGDYSIVGQDGQPLRTGDPARDGYNSDNFSPPDIRGITSDAKGIPDYKGYLGTPSGQIKVFNPSTGKVSTL